MLKNINEDSQILVLKALKVETSSKVISVLEEMSVNYKAKFGSVEEKLKAIVELKEFLSPQSFYTFLIMTF